jgi:hypothetical protein
VNRIPKILSVLLFAAFAAAGCLRPQGVQTADVDPAGWRNDQPATVTFDCRDTTLIRDLSVVVRYDRSVGMDVLPLVIRVQSPDSLVLTERVEMPLPVHKKGSYAEVAMLYRNGVVFSQQGTYTFDISPQQPSVTGVHAVGIEFSTDGKR